MSLILTELQEGVGTITLNRPDKLNALAEGMRDDLVATLTVLEGDQRCRVVVLTGAGRAFCAGGDVEAMSALREKRDLKGFRALLEAGKRVVEQIVNMPK